MAKRRQELIAESLARASEAARWHVIRSDELSRTDRERLVRAEYLQPIMKGWYLLTTPEAVGGESTVWFASYWAFLAMYLQDRFGADYCLGAEASLALHLGASTVPRQITVITASGGRSVIELPHETSVLTYEDPRNLPDEEDVEKVGEEGIRAMSLPMSLIRVAPAFYHLRPGEIDIALRMVPAASDLARVLIKGGYVAPAERIVGAYRSLEDEAKAKEIETDMQESGYELKPVDPFDGSYVSPLVERRIASPYAARLRSMWATMREAVIDNFKGTPGTPVDAGDYLRDVDDNYQNDAYNSLSIEGYRVTPELIEQLRNGEKAQTEDVSTLAVMGYNRSFKRVEESIAKILEGEDPGLTVAEYLHIWYRSLFSPCVEAGLLEEHALIGYRRQPVYIKGSKHVPPPWTAVPDCMGTFLDLLQHEDSAAVRIVLGHFLFVFIHPYTDGNGRLARFLMNAMLASGGYAWTTIPMARRDEYMLALEAASAGGDIAPFSRFLASLVGERDADGSSKR